MKNILLVLTTTALVACNSDFYSADDIHKEYKHIRVYKDDAALMCDDTQIKIKTHGKELVNQNIEVHCAQKGYDGFGYAEVCGGETGTINIFTIHQGDLAQAENLGFSRLTDLPDAVFDEHCESKVIYDHDRYMLLEQLKDNYDIWQNINDTEYRYRFHKSYIDCPSFAPMPTVEITVINNQVSTVYNLDNEAFITNLDDFMTIDELFSDIKLQLDLAPFAASRNAAENNRLPTFNELGVPTSYYIDAGSTSCDAMQITLSHVDLNVGAD